MNFAMAIVDWENSDIAFYQAIFKKLVKLESLTDNDLMELVKRRAQEIMNQLKKAGELDDARVIPGSPGPVKKPPNKPSIPTFRWRSSSPQPKGEKREAFHLSSRGKVPLRDIGDYLAAHASHFSIHP